MKNHLWPLSLGVALCTVAYIALLVLLEHWRLGPVLLQGHSTLPGQPPHNTAILSPIGSGAWLALASAYALLCVKWAQRLTGQPAEGKRWSAALALGLLTLATSGVFHPLFLLAVLPLELRAAFTTLVEQHIPLLSQIYFHAGTQRLWFYPVSVHLAVALVWMLLVTRRYSPE